MAPNLHVVYGSEALLSKYMNSNKLWGQYGVMATHPDKVQKIIDYHQGDLNVVTVRYPADIWKPSTDPCSKRVKETDGILKTWRRAHGDKFKEVEIVPEPLAKSETAARIRS